MRLAAKPFSKYAATLALSTLLAACGGGGSDPVEETGGGGGVNPETGIGGSPLVDGGMVGDSNVACNDASKDRDSSDADWNNNCQIQADPNPDDDVNENFAESNYTGGIQRIIWCLGHGSDYTLADFVDRDFGPRTEAAVKSFQRQSGLLDDGIVGTMTWDALRESLEQVGSNDSSAAWAIADPIYLETTDPIYESSECLDQPAFWEYLSQDVSTKAWTLTLRDTGDTTDTTTFGRTDEAIFGNQAIGELDL